MGLQGVSSIGQSSRRMIALALAKDKALASVLAKVLILAPLGFNANCQRAQRGAAAPPTCPLQEGVL
jgi:hypothetical protein